MGVQEHLRRIDLLQEGLRREKIEIARQISPNEKLLAGARLFDQACRTLQGRIRELHPNATGDEVLKLLRDALAAAKQLEYLGCTVHLPDSDFYENMLKR